jgi:predicted phosphoribosyltransferase
MFIDRFDAGEQLAEKLIKFRNVPGVVLAVPRGGVPVGFIIARQLGLPIDLILTKKIGHPLNKEFAIGAANLTDHFIVERDDISPEYIEQELIRIRMNLKDMYKRYMGEMPPQNLEGKTVIVVDDGIATGNTILGTVNLLRKSKPAKIVVAAPVASLSAVEKLKKEIDEVVVVLIPEYFSGVGAFYENFDQVEDDEVMWCLDRMTLDKS